MSRDADYGQRFPATRAVRTETSAESAPAADRATWSSLRAASGRRTRECIFGRRRARRKRWQFANTGLQGLTQLSVWWLRLGIQHQRIRPASPQENGAHERMRRTLKAETTRPPGADLARQQRLFNAFRREYDEVRPHAALQGVPPAARFTSSGRAYDGTLPPLEYPSPTSP